MFYSSDLLLFETVSLCTSSGKQREPDVDETIHRAVPGIRANAVLIQHPLDDQLGVEEAEEWRGWLQVRHHGPQLGRPGDAGS